VVADTGKTLRPDAFKPVNLPEAVRVMANAAGEPAAVTAGRRQAVKSIEDRWRIDDEWWRSEEISRMYYAVVFNSGQKVVIYKDLLAGQWFRQGY
jgi:hypothetical protein